MTDRPRIVVVSHARDGWQRVGKWRWFLHGGERYRRIADELLGDHAQVEHLLWEADMPVEARGETLDAVLPGADAIVMVPWLMSDIPEFDAARFDRAPGLRAIAGTFDFRLYWIDVEEAMRRDVTIVDSSRAMTPTVAEFGVGITLALLRDIPDAIDTVRDGRWYEAPRGEGAFVFRDLRDCRVGLAGYGTINRHYRNFIRAFGPEVSIYDPFVDEDTAAADDVTLTGSLPELAAESDILVVAIPPTPTTLGVVDAPTIDALPVGSLFVLLSRMAVVDQDALWRRVRARELRAAVDVFDPEPPPSDAWFRRDPNVLPTPHIAGNVQFAHERCFQEACADTIRILEGGTPAHPAGVRDKDLYEGRSAGEVRAR